MNTRWAVSLVAICLLGSVVPRSAHGQSLAEASAREKERRRKAAESTTPTSGAKAAPAGGPAAAVTETHTESWWRSHSRTCREAVADAEAQVKYYQARIDEARTPAAPSPSGDATPAPSPRALTDAEKRDAEASLAVAQKQLAAARKQMPDLEDEARREQASPEWLR